MGLKFIDSPKYIEPKKYEVLKTKLVAELKDKAAVKSVYQMGSVRDPGISDLDIICVFKTDSNLDIDLRSSLSDNERSILTHDLFGIEEASFTKALNYGLVSNLKLLYGEDLLSDKNIGPAHKEVNTQIAFEYLIKMFISLDVQVTLGIIKLKSFLLEARAIIFDLELLNVSEGRLYEIVKEVIECRKTWFEEEIDKANLSKLILDFHNELGQFLESELVDKDFYLPSLDIKLPHDYRLIQNDKFIAEHKGFVLPNIFSFLGRKYINLQTRFNKFSYKIPYKLPEKDSIIEDRFSFYKKLVMANKTSYRHFIPLTTSLSIH
ncbi:hypothetical protein [Winogradskyella tangerina]|uniref:hypothetical protein n=1 Tax=Winogradskyella tangerina TaxID=2023240 RepID=UPI000DBE9021|nr:hypothetical protein [Winogradskyella tangerina]